MNACDLVDFFGVKIEVESAIGAGYSPCAGCDLSPSALVPACYCEQGRRIGCAGAKYGERLPDNYPGDALIFTIQPCNLPDGYFAPAPAPKYWRMAKALPTP